MAGTSAGRGSDPLCEPGHAAPKAEDPITLCGAGAAGPAGSARAVRKPLISLAFAALAEPARDQAASADA